MKTEITIIVDNKESDGIRAEWGLSAFLESFHLFNKPDDEIREIAGNIRDTGIEYVCTGHCTKERAFGILKEELGDMVEQMKVGYQIVI